MLMKQVARTIFLLMIFSFAGRSAHAVETMADYTDNPIFMSNTITPNVLIIQDNSGSMNDMAYAGSQTNPTEMPYNPAKTYFGYFSTNRKYSYASNVFTINAAGDWNGNFLNWACMRRVDVSRKVLVGGKATSRTGGGNARLIGDSAAGWWVWKFGPTDNTGLSPAAYKNTATEWFTYELLNGFLHIYKYNTATGVWTYVNAYTIVVQKDVTLEPTEFVNGNLAGIMQKVETKARWGLEFFNTGCGGAGEGCNPAHDGGNVTEPIVGTGYGVNMITTIENKSATTWTPLAESLYTAIGYFAQNSSFKYSNGDFSTGVQGKDPFYYGDLAQYVPCGKNFVILITDGDPTMDNNIPATPPAPFAPVNWLVTDDGQDAAGTAASSFATDYLDDVALWAHTTDLRSDIAGSQTLTIYTVYAFGSSLSAQKLLNQTAKNGAFTDSNANNLPDVQSEWSTSGTFLTDGVTPKADTYYEASDGAALEAQLMAAITDILKRATSGTAVSVLATSATGAGNVFQAYFLPSKTIVEGTGSRDVKWIGHLISLKIDANGSLRDGTAANGGSGNCIAFAFDSTLNQTMVNTLSGTDTCGTTVTGTSTLTSFVNYVWDAGEKLATATASSRTIFTFLDANQDGIMSGGEKIDFTTANAATLQKYLRTASLAEAQNVISWIRGESVTGYRDRTIGANQWKLGDIIHSTPTVVAGPTESYGLLYNDAGYTAWSKSQSARSTTVYVGGNDGMLHAVNAATGAEVWAYIPYNLLPHLKWLTDTAYTHVDYVDIKMKISDINWGTTGAPDWRTILIGGMRFGGGEISDASYPIDGRKWRSAFFAIDVTNPNAPVVLWELGHNITPVNALGFSMTYPAVAKVGDSFFAIVGSGAKSSYVPGYQGEATQAGSVFAINIKTGVIAANFPVTDALSWFSDPISVDLNFSTSDPGGSSGFTYNTEVVYIGETYWKSTGGGSWNSRMWRIVTNNDVNPANWKMYNLYNTNVDQPITSAPAPSMDSSGNAWLFFGTGKYYSQTDKTDTKAQNFYGIKDPCWDATTHAWSLTCSYGSLNTAGTYTPSVATANLVDVSSAVVQTNQVVTMTGLATSTWAGLIDLIKSKQGWYMNLSVSGERSLNKPTVIGGLVLFTSFVPDSSVCGLGGNSYFYALYYETGTAYYKSIIGTSGTTVMKKSTTASIGMASSIAVHSGRESGMKAYIQLSTGEATAVNFTAATKNQSGIFAWREL